MVVLTPVIPKGQRHVTLISVANSLLFNHLEYKGKIKTEKELKQFFEQISSGNVGHFPD
ncbi:MAG TPA: hypothetical protein VKA95_02310 [Nitrososphaeraceae archaeon]|nr:hypothetical protein [Nitrososphaeraceae archaeon]